MAGETDRYDRDMGEAPSQQELEAADCWEPTADRVPDRPEMTAFRQQIRLQQARWRESKGHPIGSQPIGSSRSGTRPRRVGSRVALEHARDTGANFVTAAAHDAAKARLSRKEPQQSFDAQGLWADLLSSTAMCFNLFGDLAADPRLADRAVHTWWPDAPGTVCDVRFVHSPGRLDLSYIGSLVAFDVAFVLDLGDGTQGIVAVDTKYHERRKRELPKPARLARYLEVAEKSSVFAPEAIDAVNGTELLVMWLEHLLMLSMLQHPSGAWSWGTYVVVHPAGNTDFAEGCAQYQSLVVDESTFASVTVEQLLDAGALPAATIRALRDRYLPA
jgi:PD-(D/E)XK nuclease superfamily protein